PRFFREHHLEKHLLTPGPDAERAQTWCVAAQPPPLSPTVPECCSAQLVRWVALLGSWPRASARPEKSRHLAEERKPVWGCHVQACGWSPYKRRGRTNRRYFLSETPALKRGACSRPPPQLTSVQEGSDASASTNATSFDFLVTGHSDNVPVLAQH